MFNRVTLVGYISNDVSLRYTKKNGVAIVRNNVSVHNSHKNDKTGEWENKAEWIPVMFFGKKAEYVSNHVSKGDLVLVDGALRVQRMAHSYSGDRYSAVVVYVTTIRNIKKKGEMGMDRPEPEDAELYNAEFERLLDATKVNEKEV